MSIRGSVCAVVSIHGNALGGSQWRRARKKIGEPIIKEVCDGLSSVTYLKFHKRYVSKYSISTEFSKKWGGAGPPPVPYGTTPLPTAVSMFFLMRRCLLTRTFSLRPVSPVYCIPHSLQESK